MKLSFKTIILATVMALFAACGSSNFEWFPDANEAPVANAGANQSVVVDAVVTLDGSASSDGNGDKLNYAWSITTKPTGSTATLSSSTVVSPTFTADLAGDYVCSLIVNDGAVSSAASTVTVTVKPFVNIEAYAGEDQDVTLDQKVTLDGSGSTDKKGVTGAAGGDLNYLWAFVENPGGAAGVSLTGSTSVNPTFTPTITGTYKIKLTVNDPTDPIADESTDEVIVRCNLGSITVTW